MSLLARHHRRCVGRGQYAPEPRAHSLRIPGAHSRGARGTRAGAGDRYWSQEPKSSTLGESLGRAPERGRERRAA